MIKGIMNEHLYTMCSLSLACALSLVEIAILVLLEILFHSSRMGNIEGYAAIPKFPSEHHD